MIAPTGPSIALPSPWSTPFSSASPAFLRNLSAPCVASSVLRESNILIVPPNGHLHSEVTSRGKAFSILSAPLWNLVHVSVGGKQGEPFFMVHAPKSGMLTQGLLSMVVPTKGPYRRYFLMEAVNVVSRQPLLQKSSAPV